MTSRHGRLIGVIDNQTGESWCFVYDPCELVVLFDAARRWASNPYLTFTWGMAAMVIEQAMLAANKLEGKT